MFKVEFCDRNLNKLEGWPDTLTHRPMAEELVLVPGKKLCNIYGIVHRKEHNAEDTLLLVIGTEKEL